MPGIPGGILKVAVLLLQRGGEEHMGVLLGGRSVSWIARPSRKGQQMARAAGVREDALQSRSRGARPRCSAELRALRPALHKDK